MFVLALALLLLVTVSRGDKIAPANHLLVTSGVEKATQSQRACTVHDLLPHERRGDGVASEWYNPKNKKDPAYDCTCPFYKGR